MYNGIYPINIHYRYKTDKNKQKVQSKDEENQTTGGNLSNGNASEITREELEHRYHQNSLNYGNNHNFNLNTYSNNSNNTVNNFKGKKIINIHQIVSDFRKTQIAINAPDDVVNKVNNFLSKVDYESNSDNPQKNVIQTNLKEASKLLDDYISKTLNKDSHVVEGWLNALFLQDIDYKNNPNDINETFKLKFPKGSKVDEKISENLDILYPNAPKSASLQTRENVITQEEPLTASTDIQDNSSMAFPDAKADERQANGSNIINLDSKPVETNNNAGESARSSNVLTLPRLEEEKQNVNIETSQRNITKNYIPDDETLKSLFTQAKILGNAKDYQNALDFYEDALNYANQIGDTKIEPLIYYEAAKIYDRTDNINTAIEYYSNAINVSVDNVNIKALSHMALGRIYDESSIIDTSLDHYIAAVSYGGESENIKLQSYALLDIGEIYASTYNKEAAFDFIETAKDMADETNDSKIIGKVYSKSAKTYKNFNENLQALKDLKVSTMELDKTSSALKNSIENYIMAASILIDLNNPNKAKSLLSKALNMANEAQLDQYLPQINSLSKLI